MNCGCFTPGRGRAPLWAAASVLVPVVLAMAPARPLNAQGPLEGRVPVERTLQPGERHHYTIALDAGACARVILATDLSLAATLQRPDGSPVVVIDNASQETAPQPLTIVAQTAGTYAIDLALAESTRSGPYRLALEVVAAASDADRRQAEAESLFREGLRLFNQTARESRLSAAERYGRAADIFHALGNRAMEAKAIDKTGQVYNRLGETRPALEAYRRVLVLYRELGNRGSEASTLNNVALEQINQGAYAEAIEPLVESAEIFREIGDHWTERSPINNLGMAYYFLGETDNSEREYRRALELGRANYDESGEAYATMGLAGIASERGRLQDTLNYFARAIELYRRLGNRQLEALALSNIGVTHLKFGDAESALDYLQRAQELRKLAPNRLNEAATLGNIGSAYRLLGEPRKALEFVNTQVRMLRELGSRGQEADALGNLGWIQGGLGDVESATASYAASRNLARESGNRGAEVFALAGLSRIRLKQAAPAEAVALASEAVSLAHQGTLRIAERAALMALGEAELSSNALEAAREHTNRAIEIAESIRLSVAGPDQRTSYIGQYHDAYGQLIDVLMRLHHEQPSGGFVQQAFEVSERARARTLIDLLGESRSNIREGVDAALVSREESLRAALAIRRGESDDRVQSLLIEYRNLQNEIRARSPRYASLVEPQSSGLDVLQHDLLDEDTVLVEYALGEQRSYVWVIGPGSVTSHELSPRRQIEALARGAHEALSQPDSPAVQETLRALSRAVIEPIASRIAGKRLAVVTEGALQYVPFAALPDGEGRPLIRSHEIVSLPSASTLQALRRDAAGRPRATQALFVVGDPVFDRRDSRVGGGGPQKAAVAGTAMTRSARESGADLERLWFTRQEANSIAALAGRDGVQKLLDFDATLERVTAAGLSSFRVVHFATHGLLNNKHPELSGLVFSLVDSRGRPRDGFLPVYEVYNLRLNADLVVLSACQTALGEDIRGEGLVGLTRAFMYAGTPRVVASLWRVPDSATAALMERFYRGMLSRHLPPAEALRTAQESVRREPRWAAPYYWAGFTLVGEWK
jgi:CHAT domain-containing protein/tetratricopeptide (TPR) repeat protein